MKTGLLKRIKTQDVVSGAPLRTNEVYGSFKHMPEVGQCFGIVAKALDDSAVARLVYTSIVKSVERTSKGYRFHTENSTYELDFDVQKS